MFGGGGKGGVAKIFAPLSNACYVIPPLPRLCIADSALASPRCFSLWLAASPTSREGPAHSSMSEPQPGRAQRQGRRGGRAGAGLRHPGRVSSQVPPRAGRGALHARPTESAAGRPRCPPGAFAGGGKRPPPPLHPACLRMRQTGRPLLAAGGAGGWGGAGGRGRRKRNSRSLGRNRLQGAPAGQAGGSRAKPAPSEHGQRVRSGATGGAGVRRPAILGTLIEAGLARGRKGETHVSSRPAWLAGRAWMLRRVEPRSSSGAASGNRAMGRGPHRTGEGLRLGMGGNNGLREPSSLLPFCPNAKEPRSPSPEKPTPPHEVGALIFHRAP